MFRLSSFMVFVLVAGFSFWSGHPVSADLRTSVSATAMTAVEPSRVSVFAYPQGLSAPPELLFHRLGFIPGNSVPLTRETIFEIAYKCFISERYNDGLIMAIHGIAQTGDARLWLMKSVCEMHLGRWKDAENSVTEYRIAEAAGRIFGLGTARERIGGPMRARFELILIHQLTSEAMAPGATPAAVSPPPQPQ